MADPSATICIYARFPKDLIPNTDLNPDPANWAWAKCLAFPVNRLNDLEFSSKPYKWIRYATGVVVGAHGDLSAQPDSPPVAIDYDSGLSSTSMDLYYHTTVEEKRRMFPIDPKMADTRVVTSSRTSIRRDAFRREVETRDTCCVVTGFPSEVCDAAHILPHAKGDQYIRTFSMHRRRGSTGGDNDIVNSIDDVRNGLFVNKIIHVVLGTHVAFLKMSLFDLVQDLGRKLIVFEQTPNFAMNTTDVDPNAGSSEERFTCHIFDRSLWPYYTARSGQTIRVPSSDAGKLEWPPPSLFDAIYASALICHFGVLPTDLLKKWDAVFYEPDGASKAGQTNDKRRPDQDDAEKRLCEKHNTERDERKQRYDDRRQGDQRRRRDGAFDAFDVLMMVPFTVMPAEKVREYLEGCRKMAAEKEREELDVKVNSWMEGVLDNR